MARSAAWRSNCSEEEQRSPQTVQRTTGGERISPDTRESACDGRTEGKCLEEADGGRFDTIGKKSCFRGSHRWSKIRLRGRIVDAAAVKRHRTSLATVCGSRERSVDKETGARRFGV